MKQNKPEAAFFMAFLFCLATTGFAQAHMDKAPVTCGGYRQIHSKVLAEDRILLVRLPDDYGKSDKKYPVIYKLDGDKRIFLNALSAACYLYDMTDNAPDPIIVGIENTDRNRDMGPDQGADRFIQFIGDELIPFIENNYRTNGFRILCGQSLSSIFALYSFLERPMLFDAYILASFGLYKDSLSQQFENELKKNRDLKKVGKKYLFVANGKLDALDPDGSIGKKGEQFLESLRQTVPASVLLKSKSYDDEGHVPYPALYDGLKWVYACVKAETTPAEAKGPYFGQKPPGNTPEIFAPGIISLAKRLEDNIAFSPDGDECFFTVWGANYSSAKIYWTKRVNNFWTPQIEAPFSVGHYAKGPFFSTDGNKLYFGYGGPEPNAIWMVRRTAQGWSDPQRLDSPINSTYRDYAYTETAGGVGYFASNRPGGQGTTNLNDIWRTRQVPGGPLEVENLGAIVNSTAADFNPCIAHDGSYLIFTSERPGRVGVSDLYVSFPNGNGGWTAPVNLNSFCPGINIAGCANVGPSLSPDGRYLFFTRCSRTTAGEQEDIYWVDNPFREPVFAKPAQQEFSTLKGPYLGQRPPRLVPEIFAHGIISTDDCFEYGGVYSPDMKEFYFVRRGGETKKNVLFVTKYDNGSWTEPEALPFMGEPFFAPDGKILYLGNKFVEKTATGWSEIKFLGLPFKDMPIMRLAVSAKGTFYLDQMKMGSGISFSRFSDGRWQEPAELGAEINAGTYSAHPFVAPDESYLIWDSEREGGLGSDDLYISFRNKDGSWNKAVNMGDKINTNLSEMFASVTPDGKYIFFCRYQDFDRGDIYWVDAKIIENLRPAKQ